MVIISVMLSLFGPLSSHAMVKNGIELPDLIKAQDKTLVLNGAGQRSKSLLITSVKVYVAGLYLESKSTNADEILASPQAKRLELKFQRDVGVDKVRSTWRENFETNCDADCTKSLSPSIEAFLGFFGDAKEGDTVSYLFNGDSVEVYTNARKLGEIKNPLFSKVVLSAWLGKNPISEDLKNELLGVKNK